MSATTKAEKKALDEFEKETSQEKGAKTKSKAEKKPKKTPKEKFISKIMRKAGVDVIPGIETLFEGNTGHKMKISDIAFFIDGHEDNEILSEIAEQATLRNTINLSTKVTTEQVEKVGIQVLEAGRIWMAIEVAKLTDGTQQAECWSGRHRLAFLSLLYGVDVEVPVRLTEMTTAQARDAVVYANRTRRVQAREKAELSALRSVQGDDITDMELSNLYKSMGVSKTGVKEFCVVALLNDLTPKTYQFKYGIAPTTSRKNAEMVTVAGLKGYCASVFRDWSREMETKEFMEQFKDSITFLNSLIAELQKDEQFDPKQQLSGNALVAIGKLYGKLNSIEKTTAYDYIDYIVPSLIEMGQIGRHRSEEIYSKLFTSVREKVEAAS